MATVPDQPPARRQPPPWMVKARRVLDVLATGGMIWLTEPQPPKQPAKHRK